MTDTIAAAPEDPAPGPPREPAGHPTTGPWATLVPALLVVVLLGVLVMAAVALQRRGEPAVSATPQIAWMQQGCRQWVESGGGSTSGTGPDAQWCASMATWMDGRMPRTGMPAGQIGPGQMGQGQMAGPMMWQSPASMQATCEQWASSTSVPAGTDASTHCAQMVTWMSQHMGDWDRWMTEGPMMGTPPGTR